MEMIISHKSALEYYRLHRNDEIKDNARLRHKSIPTNIPSITDLRDAVPMGLSYPINLLVRSQDAKCRSKSVKPRVYSGQIPDRSFIKVNERILISSPVFCFFQMASDLSLVELIELGLEFCGSYSLPTSYELDQGNVDDKNLYGHPQLTGKKELIAYTNRMRGINGQKKASRALRYIANGSASPMETILVMLLTLPHILGGYGLPTPILNRKIELGKAASKRSGRAFYVCDLFWNEANFAIEYDSNLYHTGTDRIVRDSKKRLELDALDIDVMTVTSNQIRDIKSFEIIAKLAAKKLGKRLQYNDKEQFLKAQKELRSKLLKTNQPLEISVDI